VPPADLLVANGRFESTTWTATVLGPPLGGAAIGLFGPVVTVTADAVSYLLSAAAIRAIGRPEPRPVRAKAPSYEAVATRQPAPATTPASEPTPASQPAPAATPASGPTPAWQPVPAATPAAGPTPASQPVPSAAPQPVSTAARRRRAGGLLEGWRYILAHPALRPLFFNTTLVNGLIMATAPLLAVLMLGRLGFAPWQYGLAFAVPCLGGLIGSRLAHRLVTRFGRHRVMLTAGTLRACWSFGLAFVGPGVAGLVLVIVVEFGLITCMGVFNPVFATYRLDRTATDRVARTLSAWSVTSKATTAALTALWGVLASVTGPRMAIAAAGLLMLATPLLLPRRDRPPADLPRADLPAAVRSPGASPPSDLAPDDPAAGTLSPAPSRRATPI
jgi:hypothetical protein